MIAVKRILELTALLLTETTLSISEDGDSPFPSLGGRIRGEVVAAARKIMDEAPLVILASEARQFKDTSLTVSSDGIGILPLPDSFHRLHSLRLSSWGRDVVTAESAASGLRVMEETGFKGIGGCCSRPRAYFSLSDDGTRVLKLYRCEADDKIERGFYIPEPAITDSDDLIFPERLLPDLCRELASRIISDL